MPTTVNPPTNTASTQDWLRASKHMRICAYDPTLADKSAPAESTDQFAQQKLRLDPEKIPE